MGNVMKQIVFTGILLTLLSFWASAMANPPCPKAGNQLEDFAYCMKPFANGRGQVMAGSYSSGGMDHHTAALMNSMHQTVASPQVMPTVPAAVSMLSNMAIAATATYRMPSNYNYWMWGNPYMWMGMGMGIPVYP